ncbi:MAG: DUF5667 domain-containing protein, partial [Patescibacteria group bacterium]
MKFKKHFKAFFRKSSVKSSNHHHKKRAAVFWQKVVRILTKKLIVIFFLILFLLYFGVAFAQAPVHELVGRFTKPKPITQSSTILSASIQQAIEDEAKNEIIEEKARQFLATDPSITSYDLSTSSPQQSLQQAESSFLQTISETVEELTTTDPAVKAKIKIRRIDRKIAKLQNLLENDRSNKAIKQAVTLIKEIGLQTAAVAKDPKIQTDREVLALQIAQHNRLQLILQKIEEELPLGDALIIEDARQKYLVPTAVAGINAAPNLEALHNIAVKEVAKVVGKDFAELKAIEIISDVENDVKPEAKKKLLGLEKELAREFEKKMLKLPRDARNRKLQNYAHYSVGDPLRQIKSLNQIQDSLSDREIILGVESLKEIEMKKLIHRVFTLKDQKSLDDFTDRILQNPEDLRVLAEMELAINAGRDEVEKSKFAQMKKSTLPRYAQFFKGQKLSDLEVSFTPEAHRPTDILDVLLISNLETIAIASPDVSSEVKQLFRDLKKRNHERFIAEITSKDFLTKSTLSYNPASTNADVRILLGNPQGIALLQKLQQEANQNDKAKIDVALRAQSGILQERLLTQVNDPEIFEDYNQFISRNPEVKQIVQKYASPTFFTNLSKKSQAISKIAKQDEQHLYEVIQQVTQAIFITKKTTDLEKKLPTAIQQQITQLKKDLPEKSIPQLTVPNGVKLSKIAKLPSSVEYAIVQAAKTRIREKAESPDVKLDLQVTAADLDVSDPWLLPDNPFYFIKSVIRKAQLVFTFDPLSRAELLVRQNNERTLEAAKLIEKDSSRKSLTIALAVLADVQKDFNILKENSGKLDTVRQTQPERVDKLVDTIIKNGLARQTVFSAISAKVYGEDYVRIEKIRQSILKDGIDSLLQLSGGNVETLVARLESAVNTGSGSKFKELKAIELLTEIRRFQPEKIDLILEKSEVRLVKKLEAKLLAMNRTEREAELIAYAQGLPGNPVRQFEAYEHVKDSFENPQLVVLADRLQDEVVENLKERLSEITTETTMLEFAKEVVGSEPEALKIITAIELRVDTPSAAGEITPIEEKVEEIKDLIEEHIIDEYANNPTGLAESDLFGDSGHEDNVSVIDVIVVDELEEVLERTPEVSPDVVEVVTELKEEVTNEFIDTVSNTDLSISLDTEVAVSPTPTASVDTQVNTDTQISTETEQINSATETLHILEPIPQIIETLVELKEEASPSEDVKIDAAIEVQVELIKEYIEIEVADPTL